MQSVRGNNRFAHCPGPWFGFRAFGLSGSGHGPDCEDVLRHARSRLCGFHVKQQSRTPKNSSGRPRSGKGAPDRGSLAFALREAGRLVEKVIEGRNLSVVWEKALAAHAQWTDAER